MALLYAHKDYIRRTLTLYENWANKDSSWRWPSSIMRSHSTWRTLTLYGYPQINKLFQRMKLVNFHVRSGDAMKRTVLAFFSEWATTENRPVLSSKSRCSLHCKNKSLVGYKMFLKGLGIFEHGSRCRSQLYVDGTDGDQVRGFSDVWNLFSVQTKSLSILFLHVRKCTWRSVGYCKSSPFLSMGTCLWPFTNRSTTTHPRLTFKTFLFTATSSVISGPLESLILQIILNGSSNRWPFLG